PFRELARRLRRGREHEISGAQLGAPSDPLSITRVDEGAGIPEIEAVDDGPDRAIVLQLEAEQLAVHELDALRFEVAPPRIQPGLARRSAERAVAVSARADLVQNELPKRDSLRPRVALGGIHRHERLGPLAEQLARGRSVAVAIDELPPR